MRLQDYQGLRVLAAGLWEELEKFGAVDQWRLSICELSLEDCFDGFSEDHNASRNGDSKDGAHNVLMRTNILSGVK